MYYDPEVIRSLWIMVVPSLTMIVMALVTFFVGWVVARSASRLVERLVHRISHHPRIKGLVEIKDDYRIDKVIGVATYYLLMVIVLVLVFDILGFTAVLTPLQAIVGSFALAIPHLVQAALIFLMAWILATVLRSITIRLLNAPSMGSLLRKLGAVEEDASRLRFVSASGSIVYYLVLLFFLPAVLGALQLQGVATPFEALFTQIFGYLPNILAAALTVLVGYIAARIARGIVSHFLASLGVNTLPGKIGIEQVFRDKSLSQVLGTVVFVLILLPVAISALETLGVAAISVPAISMLTVVLNMIPNVAIALILLGVGIAVARWVGTQAAALLTNTNLPQFLTRYGVTTSAEVEAQVPGVLGNVVTGVIVLLVSAEVFDILHLTLLSGLLRDIIAFLPNVVVAVVILAVGWAVGAFANRSLRSLLQQGPYPAWLGTVAKVAIVVVAAMMALEQLGVAQSIVVSGFTILLGSVGLAAAIAVGSGSKDLVAQWVKRWAPQGDD